MSPRHDDEHGDRILAAIASSPTASRLMAATFRTDTLRDRVHAIAHPDGSVEVTDAGHRAGIHPPDCPCQRDRWADLHAITARATGGRP